MGFVQLWTSVLKFIPLVFMSTVGLFYINTANFEVWNISGESTIGAIGGAMALCLFSYLGVETASVAAAKVRDPDTNVPKATIYGTLGTAVVYLLSLTAVFGIVSAAALSESTAPFATAVNEIFGGTWAGYVMSGLVVISGFGALNGWTMICAEMPLAAAKDGLFPDAFGRLSQRGVPRFGIIASTVLASVFMVLSYAGSVGITVFNTLVFMSGITAAIPYAFSALAQIKWRMADHRTLRTPRFARDVGIAVVGLLFSVLFIWYSRNTGGSLWQEYLPFIFAGGAFLAGIPIYLSHRGHMAPPPAVPEWRP
jgi:APA family basic amino acid/polyamine antiporter